MTTRSQPIIHSTITTILFEHSPRRLVSNEAFHLSSTLHRCCQLIVTRAAKRRARAQDTLEPRRQGSTNLKNDDDDDYDERSATAA